METDDATGPKKLKPTPRKATRAELEAEHLRHRLAAWLADVATNGSRTDEEEDDTLRPAA